MNTFTPSTINLASEPFRRERAQNAGLGLLCLGLACSLLILGTLILHARAQAADLRRVIAAENAQLRRAQRDEAQFSSVLGKPGNADVFSTSVFLNELIARRAVSWTQVFKDLGTVMPSNVRLVGIRLPQVAAPQGGSGVNRVELEMSVGTDRPEAVIELLKRLQESPLFGAAEVKAQHPPTQNDPLYKYQMTVAYAQKL
jgi:type IV pilus assembly protein PilN